MLAIRSPISSTWKSGGSRFSTKILYVLAEDVGTERATYSPQMADVDGERTRTLYRSTARFCQQAGHRWPACGLRVVEVGRPSIILQDVSGPNREQLTGFRGINGSPVFSPDGKQLAMVLSRSGDPEIFVMNLENRKLRRITRHPAIDTEPSWSPDGKYLVFTSDRGGKPQIYQLELATNFLERYRLLATQCSSAAVARWQALGVRASSQRRLSLHGRIYCHRLVVLTESELDRVPLGAKRCHADLRHQDQDKGILAVVSVDGGSYRLPSSVGDVREPSWSPFLPDVVRASE